MKLAVISFTRTGEGICEKLSKALTERRRSWTAQAIAGRKTGNAGFDVTARIRDTLRVDRAAVCRM